MDTALMLIAIACAAAAITMGAISWRVIHEDRRRSAARVLALRAAAASSGAVELDDAVFQKAAPSSVDSEQMFAAVRRPSSNTRRPLLLLVGTAAVIVVAGGLFLSGRGDESSTPLSTTNGSISNAAALELLSMRHTRDGNTWTITGLVRNPQDSGEAAHVSAVAFLFARDGSFLGSGRAPLDFSTLAAGDESPFEIKVASSAPVGRYRISFRAQDGRMMRHVDKRPASTTAGVEAEAR